MSTAAAPEAPAVPRAAATTGVRVEKKRPPILFIVLGIAAIIAAVYGIPKWNYSRAHESTDNAQVDGHIIPVVSRVAGFVQQVRVNENQRVKAGDTLAILDASEFRARLAQSDADLEASRAIAGGRGVSGQSQTVVRSATNQRASLEAQLTSARASVAKAQSDLARLEELTAKQIVSKQQVDAARLAVQAATANVESLEQQFAGATAGVENAESGTRLARARLGAAQASRDNAALQLSYTVITAPRSGLVSRKQIETGQLVQAGQPVLTIVGDDDVWVSANFKETQLSVLRVGQPAEFNVDAYEGCTAKGVIESVSAATGAKFALIPPDNATGNFTKVVQRVPLRINVTQGCGADRPLRPGMSVTAHVKTR
ncbi:MAG: HlyD family secretion protein [Gemmatimonadaceae bacterium]